MKNITQTLLLIFLTIFSVSAQESLELSLEEAQNYAIQNNKTLKNARLNIEVNDRKIKEAISQGLPQVDATVDYMTYFNYEVEFNLSMGGENDFNQQQIQQAMQSTMQQFPGVTEQDLYKYQAGSYFSQQLQSMLPPSTIKMTDQSGAKIQVGQLLFSGQYLIGIKTAKLARKIAEQGLENSILDIKETVSNTYFMALVSQKSLDVMNKNIASMQEVMKHTEMMFETGVAEQTDVDQISIQLTLLQNSKRAMERGLEMTYNLLGIQLGLDNKTNVKLSSSIDEITSTVKATEVTEQELNLEENPAYQLSSTQEEISNKMVDMEKWAYSPTITAFYTYNEKFLTTGFDMNPKHMAGVSMSIPVFSSGARKHKLEQAKLQLEQAQNQKSLLTDQLLMQEKQLKFNLQSALEDYNSQKENVKIAKRAFENTNRKYEQGMVSSLDLTQTNMNYLQAETGFIQSTLSLLQAKIALDKLYNNL